MFNNVPTKPVKLVTAEFLNKAAHFSKEDRAEFAAGWLRGLVAVKPTLALAALVFRVSTPLIVAARRQLDEHTNGTGTRITGPAISPVISDSVIDNMITELGPDRVWAALDRWTAPELPLVAAA
jgi:hypothetical protein